MALNKILSSNRSIKLLALLHNQESPLISGDRCFLLTYNTLLKPVQSTALMLHLMDAVGADGYSDFLCML